MYPKHFFERFWEGEQKNQLFVAIAFSAIDNRFDIIDKSAKSLGFEKAHRLGLETEANNINDKIFDGIANSKMLIFDLSDDSTGKPNVNVMYELGIANAIREPFDIVLIRKRSNGKLELPFDIQGLNVNPFDNEVTEEFLKPVITSALERQQWHKSKRVEMAAQSLDEISLSLMMKLGRKPEHNHFNSANFNAIQKMSLLRLLDLGIIKFAWSIWSDKTRFEAAYHWTSFGYEVMKHMGIERMSVEEYRATPEYQEDLRAIEEFRESKNKALGLGD